MARYREKILPTPLTLGLLAVSFLIFFFPWGLGDHELHWREGYLAAQMLELDWGPLPLITVHGEAVPNAFPLFPMLGAGLYALGLAPELALRLLSLAGLLGCAIVVFTVAKRVGGIAAAGAATAVLIGTTLVIEKSIDGYSDWLFILLIFSGQLCWYYYAAARGNWGRAWLIGLLFCALAFYTDGVSALVFFAVPLIFMRRPLSIFSRLKRGGLALGGGVFLAVFLVWYLPYHFEGVVTARSYIQYGFLDFPDYLLHLAEFPAQVLVRFLPWSLLAWTPFCVAFQALDPLPIFSRFLRTLVIATFFLLWLAPQDEARAMMLLLPPLAIMTGINYALLVRRYGNFYRRLFNWLAWLPPVTGLLIVAFFLLPSELLTALPGFPAALDFSDDPARTVVGVAAGGLLLVLGGLLLRGGEKPPVWAYLLLLSWAPALFFWTVVMPYRAQEMPRRTIALELRRALLTDGGGMLPERIYKYEFPDLFGEGCYLQIPLRKLDSLEMLPGAEAPTVYLIAPDFPRHADRSWRNLLSAPPESRGRRVNLWKGDYQKPEKERKKR